VKSEERPQISRGAAPVSDKENGRRQRLNEMLASLQSQQIQLMRAFRDRDSRVPGDEIDDAAREDDFELSTSLADIAAARRSAIEDALQRVEQGGYGLCEDCGEEIAPARLHAIPTAVLCVDCQSAREAQSKRIQVHRDRPFLWVTADSSVVPSDEVDPDPAQTGNGLAGGESIMRRRRGRPPGTTRTLTGTKRA
jgi:DnaK suppressor protein